MKTKLIPGLILASVCFSSFDLQGNESAEIDFYRQKFAAVAVAELPNTVAQVIKQSGLPDRQLITKSVVKAALANRASAAADIVAAIGRSVPEMASVAAGCAAEQLPKQAPRLARAAAVAAPGTVGKIVQSVCRAVPEDYRNIAVAVSEVVPALGKEILDAVAASVPNTKASIQLSLLSYGGNITSVAEVLDQAKSIPRTSPAVATPTATTTLSASGPTVGPPYVPLTRTPANIGPENSGAVPDPIRRAVEP